MPPSNPPKICHPVYGEGDCSEFDFCGESSGRGACSMGRCRCGPGYGGSSCELEAVCHWWDPINSRWSAEGMSTMPSAIQESGHPFVRVTPEAPDGTIRCQASGMRDTNNHTEYAAIWAPSVWWPPPPPPPAAPWVMDAQALTIASFAENPAFVAVLTILLLNLATLYTSWKLRRAGPGGLRDLVGEMNIMSRLRRLAPGKKAPAPEPATAPAALPNIKAQFVIEGEPLKFDEAAQSAFRRRLCTLLGVDTDYAKVACETEDGIRVDVDIECLDGTTLGLALGVKLKGKPIVHSAGGGPR